MNEIIHGVARDLLQGSTIKAVHHTIDVRNGDFLDLEVFKRHTSGYGYTRATVRISVGTNNMLNLEIPVRLFEC